MEEMTIYIYKPLTMLSAEMEKKNFKFRIADIDYIDTVLYSRKYPCFGQIISMNIHLR